MTILSQAQIKLHSEHEWKINAQGNPNKLYHRGHRTVTDLMLKRRLSNKHSWFWITEIKNHLQLSVMLQKQSANMLTLQTANNLQQIIK
jgi:hypothetical protein